MQHVTLNNGIQMPIVGFGVFQIADAEECKRSVVDAIEAGYRLIDTAASYMRAIGVSNFHPDRLMDITAFNEVAPAANQVEVTPHLRSVT